MSPTCERVLSHVCVSHVDVSHTGSLQNGIARLNVDAEVQKTSHVSFMDQSCLKYERLMSHIGISPVSRRNEGIARLNVDAEACT